MVKIAKYKRKTPFRCAECEWATGKDTIKCIKLHRDVNHFGWCGNFEHKKQPKREE